MELCFLCSLGWPEHSPMGSLAGAQDSGITNHFPWAVTALAKGLGDIKFIQGSVANAYFYRLLVVFHWLGPTLSSRKQKEKRERLLTSDACFLHTFTVLPHPQRGQVRNPWIASLTIGKFFFPDWCILTNFEKLSFLLWGGVCVCTCVCWGKGGRAVTVSGVHTCPLVKKLAHAIRGGSKVQWKKGGRGIPLASRAGFLAFLTPPLADWSGSRLSLPGLCLGRAGLHLQGTDGVWEESARTSRLGSFPARLWFAGSRVPGLKATAPLALGW